MLAVHGWLERRQDRRGGRDAARRSRRPVRGRGERAWFVANLALLAVWLGVPLAVLVDRSFRVGDGYGLAGWRALGGVSAGLAPVRVAARGGRQLAAVRRGRHGARGRARRAGRGRAGALAGPRGRGPSTACCSSRSAPRRSPSASGSSSRSTSRWTSGPARGSSRSPRPWSRSRSSCARMTPVLRSIDPRLREAAAVLGASPRAGVAGRRPARSCGGRCSWRPGFAFAISLGEFGATVVIARADAPTVPDHHRPAARPARARSTSRRASR